LVRRHACLIGCALALRAARTTLGSGRQGSRNHSGFSVPTVLVGGKKTIAALLFQA
jgi:hypothetical protein